MIELPLVVLAGILGSSHCLGMCGPFALLIGSRSTSIQAAWMRQLAYSAGRIFTYTFLGAAAGFIGLRIASALAIVVNASALLCVIAGFALIYHGLLSAGLLPRTKPMGSFEAVPCLGASFLRPLLTGNRMRDVFAAGIVTGFLPCGLLYAFVALAASSRSVLTGALLMMAFGIGTGPLMMIAGLSGVLLSGAMRRRLHWIAAWCAHPYGSAVRGARPASSTGLRRRHTRVRFATHAYERARWRIFILRRRTMIVRRGLSARSNCAMSGAATSGRRCASAVIARTRRNHSGQALLVVNWLRN